jgi:hypothetical protein
MWSEINFYYSLLTRHGWIDGWIKTGWDKIFARGIQIGPDEWTNQGITVNLPLASVNCHSAHADAPSYYSTLRIGFENVHILRDNRLEQLHRRWNAYSSSIPQAMQIDSSIRPMLCRCLFNGRCPVMSPTNLDQSWPILTNLVSRLDRTESFHFSSITKMNEEPVTCLMRCLPFL